MNTILRDPPCQANNFHEKHVELLLNCYERLLGKPLVTLTAEPPLGRQIFESDFALLSHNTDRDPLFNYANRKALRLFDFSWLELMETPSRLSAELVEREEREKLLAEVAEKGFINHYSGIRIAKNGTRFQIRDAVVWNLHNSQGIYCGQAAFFKNWRLLA